MWVRGNWAASGYFKGEGGDRLDEDGWFPTGDVATLDEHGFMRITDRNKDVIKSGGEWISSIDLENAAMGTPGREAGRGHRRLPSQVGGAAAHGCRAARRPQPG